MDLNEFQIKEIFFEPSLPVKEIIERFKNKLKEFNFHFYWDRLTREIKLSEKGFKIAEELLLFTFHRNEDQLFEKN